MKQKLLMLALLSAMCAGLTACGGDDEEEVIASKIDPALTGVWVRTNPDNDKEIYEAVAFRQDGEILIHSGDWYEGNYVIADEGQIKAHVCKIRMTGFRWFDDYDAWAADPVYNDWYFFYIISGNKLTMKHDGTYLTWTLERLKE